MKYIMFIYLVVGSYFAKSQTDSVIYANFDSATYKQVEISATFPGGMNALKYYFDKNMKYPKTAKRKNISGTVVVDFTVDRQGRPSDYYLFQTVDPALDEEALRLIKNIGRWAPAIQNGRQIDSRLRVNVLFQLKTLLGENP